MNFFKPKDSPPQPRPAPPPPPPPPRTVQFIHQVFSFFQTNLSNFLPFSTPPSPKSPLLARISDTINAVSPGSPFSLDKNNSDGSGKSRSSSAMNFEAIEERLAAVPVYALSNSAGEFVMVSGSNSRKSLGLFCFNEADAIAFLDQLKSMDQSMQNGSQVVPVALNKLVQIKLDGVSFRFIPEASQVKNAIKERKKSGTNDDSFPGVPVFQSKSLVLRSQDKRYRPVFFRKEDLEKSLQRASGQQKVMNPALRTGDIEIAVLEDIIQGMKDNLSSQWNDVVFIPPGFDVATGRH